MLRVTHDANTSYKQNGAVQCKACPMSMLYTSLAADYIHDLGTFLMR